MARDVIMHLSLDEIVVPEGRRPLNAEAVSRLAGSIEKIGLQTPITCRSIGSGKFELVAGNHRLAAVRSLGMESIQAAVVRINDTDARLWEIAENLHRTELSKQERSDQIAEWVRLTEQKLAQLAPVSSTGGRGNEGGVRAAARELGIDRTEVNRAVQIASITPEAKEAVREAKLDDNQSAMLKVAKAEPERQVAVVAEIAEAKALKVQQDIQNRAANEIAEILVDGLHADGVEAIRINLAVTTTKAITAALANLLGQALMDRRHA